MAAPFNSIESKKEEFRQYLEKGGVIDALTKVLVGLYEEPEKPASALEFLQNHLHAGGSQSADMENLKAENADLKKTIDQLKLQIEELQRKVDHKSDPVAQ